MKIKKNNKSFKRQQQQQQPQQPMNDDNISITLHKKKNYFTIINVVVDEYMK